MKSEQKASILTQNMQGCNLAKHIQINELVGSAEQQIRWL
jgi:hypothetical protein